MDNINTTCVLGIVATNGAHQSTRLDEVDQHQTSKPRRMSSTPAARRISRSAAWQHSFIMPLNAVALDAS